LAKNFPPHCRRIAAQRAADEALAGALNAQPRPSALRAALPPAAKAALLALMQNTSSAAAAISMVNRMARSSPNYFAQNNRDSGFPGCHYIICEAEFARRQIGPVLA
jgi:hypothetical protein